jgi:hypothetical protein
MLNTTFQNVLFYFVKVKSVIVNGATPPSAPPRPLELG